MTNDESPCVELRNFMQCRIIVLSRTSCYKHYSQNIELRNYSYSSPNITVIKSRKISGFGM
jgi:hypothetical protein